MKKQFKLGIIGCGFMAQTLVKGAVLSDFLHEKKIIVSDDSEEKLRELSFLGVRSTFDKKSVAENSEFVVFDVHPRDFAETVNALDAVKPEKVITLTSGLKKNTVKNAFGLNAVKVARCIPNLPCSIGSGVIGVDMIDFNNSVDDIEFISNALNCIGTVLSVDESKLDAVSGISGNGPVYAFMFMESLVDAGVKQGLTKNEAKILAVQTLIGAAEMVERDEQSLSELIMQACGIGSAAIEAVKVFEERNLRGIVADAVNACIKQSKVMSDK